MGPSCLLEHRATVSSHADTCSLVTRILSFVRRGQRGCLAAHAGTWIGHGMCTHPAVC